MFSFHTWLVMGLVSSSSLNGNFDFVTGNCISFCSLIVDRSSGFRGVHALMGKAVILRDGLLENMLYILLFSRSCVIGFCSCIRSNRHTGSVICSALYSPTFESGRALEKQQLELIEWTVVSITGPRKVRLNPRLLANTLERAHPLPVSISLEHSGQSRGSPCSIKPLWLMRNG